MLHVHTYAYCYVLTICCLLLPAVVLSQDFVSVEGTGGAVWRSSIQFSEFVCSEEGRRCLPLKEKSLLEISSGLGLAAIVAWHLGASPIVSGAWRFRSRDTDV